MSSKILLVGSNAESAKTIKNLLALNKLYKISHTETTHEAVRKLSQEKKNLVMFDTEVLNEERMGFIRALRGLGYSVPIMMMARAVSPKARDLLKLYTNAIILEKPFEHKHFFGVTNKMLEGKEVSQQTYKRFYTNQNATIEQIGNSEKYTSSMLNLSKGGAYLEVPDAQANLSGIIKLKVNLNEVEKQYEVNARVVWSSRDSQWGKGQGIGVEFIQAKDIYRNLLNNL